MPTISWFFYGIIFCNWTGPYPYKLFFPHLCQLDKHICISRKYSDFYFYFYPQENTVIDHINKILPCTPIQTLPKQIEFLISPLAGPSPTFFFSHFLERQDTTTPYLPPMACAWVMGVGNTFVWFNYCRISSDWDWALSLPDMHHDPCIMYCLAYLMH